MSMLNRSASSFDWALNQAERFGDTAIFPLPFEFSAMRHGWNDLRGKLSSQDVLRWEVRPHRECLSPKSAYGFTIINELGHQGQINGGVVQGIGYALMEELIVEETTRKQSCNFSKDGEVGNRLVCPWGPMPRHDLLPNFADYKMPTIRDIPELITVNVPDLDNPYDAIEYDDLDDEQKASVNALNLEGLLDKQLKSESIDIRLTQFILRRLSQLQDADVADQILASIDKLYPAFTDVVAYFDSLKNLTNSRRIAMGGNILALMDNSLVSNLEYHRLHLLNLFASNAAWGNVGEIFNLLVRSSDYFTKRKLILALGQSGQGFWFRQRKTEWQQFSPWERRAFLRGASSLEADERHHWYNSIRRRLDPLEAAIVSWSQQNPIHT